MEARTKRKREEKLENETSKESRIDKTNDPYPDEVIVPILSNLGEKDLCTASLSSKQFYYCANTVFDTLFKQNVLRDSGARLYTAGAKHAYFFHKRVKALEAQAFEDAVNRVLSLIFPRYIDKEKWYFLTPEQHFGDFEETSPADTYYLPLLKTIRDFDVLAVLKEVLYQISNRHLNEDWCKDFYKSFRKKDNNPLLNYFIGTMNVEVVRLLLEEGEDLNGIDRFANSPIRVLLSVVDYKRTQKYQHDCPDDPWPSCEFIAFLLVNNADFSFFDSNRKLTESLSLEEYPLSEKESSGVRVCALLFAKEAFPSSIEEEFKKTSLSAAAKEIYEEEKEKIMAEIQQQTERNSFTM